MTAVRDADRRSARALRRVAPWLPTMSAQRLGRRRPTPRCRRERAVLGRRARTAARRCAAARARGDMLVFRTATDGSGPLTVLRLLERFPETVQPQLLKGVGYQLKDEWTRRPRAVRVDRDLPARVAPRSRRAGTCRRATSTTSSKTRRSRATRVARARRAGCRGGAAIEAVYDTILLDARARDAPPRARLGLVGYADAGRWIRHRRRVRVPMDSSMRRVLASGTFRDARRFVRNTDANRAEGPPCIS